MTITSTVRKKGQPIFRFAQPPLTSELLNREYARGMSGTSSRILWRQISTRRMTKKGRAAYDLIGSGQGVFVFRCGGRGGKEHRVIIRPNGQISFPDHPTTGPDAVTVGVIQALGRKDERATCDRILASLRLPDGGSHEGDLSHGLFKLFGYQKSRMPPWVEAFVYVLVHGVPSRPYYVVWTGRTASRAPQFHYWRAHGFPPLGFPPWIFRFMDGEA